MNIGDGVLSFLVVICTFCAVKKVEIRNMPYGVIRGCLKTSNPKYRSNGRNYITRINDFD